MKIRINDLNNEVPNAPFDARFEVEYGMAQLDEFEKRVKAKTEGINKFSRLNLQEAVTYERQFYKDLKRKLQTCPSSGLK